MLKWIIGKVIWHVHNLILKIFYLKWYLTSAFFSWTSLFFLSESTINGFIFVLFIDKKLKVDLCFMRIYLFIYLKCQTHISQSNTFHRKWCRFSVWLWLNNWYFYLNLIEDELSYSLSLSVHCRVNICQSEMLNISKFKKQSLLNYVMDKLFLKVINGISVLEYMNY